MRPDARAAWFGIQAPARMSRPLVDRLATEIRAGSAELALAFLDQSCGAIGAAVSRFAHRPLRYPVRSLKYVKQFATLQARV